MPWDTQWGIDNRSWYYYGFRHPGNRANVLYFVGHVGSVRHARDGAEPNWIEVWNITSDNPPCGSSDCPPCS